MVDVFYFELITIAFRLIFLYYASKIYLIILVIFWTWQLSLITKNSFAVQFIGFIDIETSCQVIVLCLKLKIKTSSFSISLPSVIGRCKS